MKQISLMNPSKETDNKLRWQADADGVLFKIYVPKARVPQPWPKRIVVRVREVQSADPTHRPSLSQDPKRPIVAIVEKVTEHTDTIRFAPRGDRRDWEIGEPYIPRKLLPDGNIGAVQIEIEWDYSAGTWS